MRWPVILGALGLMLLVMPAWAAPGNPPPKDVTECTALCPDLYVPPGCVQLRTPRTCTCDVRCGFTPAPAPALTPAPAHGPVWRGPAHPGPWLPLAPVRRLFSPWRPR